MDKKRILYDLGLYNLITGKELTIFFLQDLFYFIVRVSFYFLLFSGLIMLIRFLGIL